MQATEIHLPDIIGKGYRDFWNWKGRYLVCKGSRGSKKSTTAGFKLIRNRMLYPRTHALVVRRYDVTHRESTYAQLIWCIHRLGVAHLWKQSLSPLQLTYKPTGQKIIFRGLDDPQSIASITVPDGWITDVWIEEAFQITSEADFDKLDLSIRGALPLGLYKQFILTFNPWDEGIWLKERFFDNPDSETLAITTNYMCNEFLGADDVRMFETMKERYPRRYEVEGLGGWGISEGLIYNNWVVEDFDWKKLLATLDADRKQLYVPKFGMDFGFSSDPTAFIAVLINETAKTIHIFDEMYKFAWTNSQIVNDLKYREYHKVRICADSAESRTIESLWALGLSRIFGATKGPDSVRAGIQKLQDYKIIVHPRCKYTEVELRNYRWSQDRSGKFLKKPSADGYDHLLDALRYATEGLGQENFSF